jgi:hypothetical protein
VTDERQSKLGLGADINTTSDPVENVGLASARSERIGVGSGDENVAKIQLASRWAEIYAPATGDTLEEALRRFKRVYNYVDSVSKLVEPDEA